PGVLEVNLTTSEINQPVDAKQFTFASLKLKDGDRVVDHGRRFEMKNGERVTVEDNAKSRLGWEPQAKTTLSDLQFKFAEWNDLVRESGELSNRAMRFDYDQIPVADRKKSYEELRAASERLARRYIALHPFMVGLHRERLGGLNCLDVVVRMEYAGAVANEA